jgi:hypothetical protein
MSHSPWIHTMNRCALQALLALTLAAPLPALAQLARNFPATALRGELLIEQPPQAQLNGRPARLAPGARIRGSNQMLLMSGAIAGQTLVVNYTIDPSGLLLDVWVLSEAERDRQPWPKTPAEAAAWSFDPVGQRWSKP